MNKSGKRSDLKDSESAAVTFPDWVFQSLEALRAKSPVTFSLKLGLRSSSKNLPEDPRLLSGSRRAKISAI